MHVFSTEIVFPPPRYGTRSWGKQKVGRTAFASIGFRAIHPACRLKKHVQVTARDHQGRPLSRSLVDCHLPPRGGWDDGYHLAIASAGCERNGIARCCDTAIRVEFFFFFVFIFSSFSLSFSFSLPSPHVSANPSRSPSLWNFVMFLQGTTTSTMSASFNCCFHSRCVSSYSPGIEIKPLMFRMRQDGERGGSQIWGEFRSAKMFSVSGTNDCFFLAS